jgi:sugar lactone lactonase YvrE
MRRIICAVLALGACAQAIGAGVGFTAKPTATRRRDTVKIAFAVSAQTDVEVAVLDSRGRVVRHLAAGMLGGAKNPPEPLGPGLRQALEWDGTDDFGEKARGGPFTVRVRAGTGVRFGRLIGAEPNNFGTVEGVAGDEDGNIYLIGSRGGSNQMAMCLRVFDSKGRYLREILPFPADLPPGSMKEVARWDARARSFRPRNLRNLNPDFYGQPGRYWANPALTLVGVSKKSGVVLSDGSKLCILELNGAVRGKRFAGRRLGKLKNSGHGPTCMAVSPDGKWLYLAGPFSSRTRYGHKYNPEYPPGRVYRTSLTGSGPFAEFATIDVDHKQGQGGAWLRNCSHRGHFTVDKGPVCGVAVDAKGNVYVADRQRECVAVFDESGREIGKVAVKDPFRVAVHPIKGTIYVTEFDCVGYHKFSCNLYKFSGYADGSKPVATHRFPVAKGLNRSHNMTLVTGEDADVIWMSGVKGGLVPLADRGESFERLSIVFKARGSVPRDWNRIAADFERDEIYISNGTSGVWRYDGETGRGGRLRSGGKPFYATDIAVGYHGLIYARTGKKYSGGFARFDRDLKPVRFEETGTHVLTPYVYSRMGNGFAERGLGVGPDGKSYLSFMYKWVGYAMAGFGPDGRPLQGKYLKSQFPAEKEKERKRYAAGMYGAGSITSALPHENGGIRVDLQGNIYLGMFHRPKGFTPPAGFGKDRGYRVSVGSVVKMPPSGCAIAPKTLSKTTTKTIDGALRVYPGLAPFSSSREAFGGNTCCVCRVPRFDVDRYGRVIMPNAITNSVLIYDNAGNLLAEFGSYGNFDSQFVNEYAEAGKAKRPTVAVPEVPLAWPTGTAVSEERIYVNDTYNRRAVRVDRTWAADASCPVN